MLKQREKKAGGEECLKAGTEQGRKEKKRKELLLGMMYMIHIQQWNNSKIYHCYSH